MKNKVKHEILSFLSSSFNVEGEIDPTISLTGSGIVNSISMIELICWLEEAYDLSIPPEDFLPEHFDTVNSIHNYILAKEAS